MTKEKNFPLFFASFLSIFSFICLMIAFQLPPKTSNNVLGVTSTNLVPCSVINSWQKLYCSNIGPTSVPTPTTYCKTGINGYSMGPACKSVEIPQGNYNLTFRCYDNYSGTVGDKNLNTCYTQSDLLAMAKSACTGHTSCIPTKTPPTPAPDCFPNGSCLTTEKKCCSGYEATVDTITCATGRKCAPPLVTKAPTPTPITPIACVPGGLCLPAGKICCSGKLLIVTTNICATGKKCIAIPTPQITSIPTKYPYPTSTPTPAPVVTSHL